MIEYKKYDTTAKELEEQRKHQQFLDAIIELLFDYPPKETQNRAGRIDMLDDFFNELLANGMPWDYYPENYKHLLWIWETIHIDTCIDLKQKNLENH